METFISKSGSRTFRTTLVPNSHVILETLVDDTVIQMKKFSVGDIAEYDSFNLSYYGPITAITTKTISIEKTGGDKARLKPDQFAWRNYDFDANKASAANSIAGMYL